MKTRISFQWQALTALALLMLVAACAPTTTRQSAGEYVDDATVTTRVKAALAQSDDVKARQVDVETFRGIVQLNGFVDSAEAKDAATDVAREVAGVREVRNNLVVDTQPDTVGQAVDDGMITARIKTALIGEDRTKAGQINVTTDNGVVHLSGFVDNNQEKAAASEVARSVAGVREVRNELDVKHDR